jgi:hypothetical protein
MLKSIVLRAIKHMHCLLMPPASRMPLRIISTTAKTCYKCGGLGHIHQHCSSPYNTVLRERRNWHPHQHK